MKHELLYFEVAAENLEAAVEKALTHLKCTRAEADVEILQTPSSGFLGLLGKRQAKVRVKLHDRGVIARQFASQLLILTGMDVELEVIPSTKQIEIHLSSNDPSLLIGRHGQMLDALQALVCTMTDRQTTDRIPIVLDVDDYRARRHEFLSHLATGLIDKVRETDKSLTTPLLTLYERRILHEIFKQEPDLQARSGKHQGDRKIIMLQKRIN